MRGKNAICSYSPISVYVSKMKFKTVCEGEQAVILNHRGEGRLVVGPQRVSCGSTWTNPLPKRPFRFENS